MNLQKQKIFLRGILPVARNRIPADVIAGITLATLAIPETMGYSKIAGMPVITGLYTMLIPVILYAVLGSSRHMVVGADSATAAIMAAGLTGLAQSGSAEYSAYAGILALMVAGLLILARLIRLGFLADFLSRTVLIGFLTGVGIQVAVMQMPGMLGLSGGNNGIFQQLGGIVSQISSVNLYTLGVSVAVLAIILGFKRISRNIPGALIAVVGLIIASKLLDLSGRGVNVLGSIPGGLPVIGLPEINLGVDTLQRLLPVAVSMVVVILAQSAATARAYAARYNEHFDENVDLVGLALANAGAGISGTFVVNGSPTKTQMVDTAGGRSQLAQLTMAGVVLLVLGFLTGPLAYLPEAVLAAVVFLIGMELVDVRGMRRIYRQRPNEFWIAVITAAAVIFLGVEEGLILAVLLSLLEHTRRGYRPQNTLIVSGKSGRWQAAAVSSHAQITSGLMIYRFNHSLYYANAELFYEEALDLANRASPALKWFCLDASAMDDIDYSASETLREVHRLLHEKGIRLVLSDVGQDVQAMLKRYQLEELLGRDAFFENIGDVVEAYKKRED